MLLAENLTKCGSNEFYCPEPSEGAPFSCLPISWRCDGGIDCQHNGQVYDEVNCRKLLCRLVSLKCWIRNLKIYTHILYNIENVARKATRYSSSRLAPVNCSSDEFNCGHSCIDADWQCDTEDDCAFGEDEANCTTPSPGNESHSEWVEITCKC